MFIFYYCLCNYKNFYVFISNYKYLSFLNIYIFDIFDISIEWLC